MKVPRYPIKQKSTFSMFVHNIVQDYSMLCPWVMGIGFVLLMLVLGTSTLTRFIAFSPVPYVNQHHVEHTRYQFPIVFVFLATPILCENGGPDYIAHSLDQAINTQPLSNIIFIANFKECPSLNNITNSSRVMKTDTSIFASNRTKHFTDLATTIFQSDRYGELWINSAIRFFLLHDFMDYFNVTSVIHVEADNLIYGDFSTLWSSLSRNYEHLAATPLTWPVNYITASVLWVNRLESLTNFTDYLMELGSKSTLWRDYLLWLRDYACCKQGGVDPDEHGNGIKPFAINEMSMLAFYHHRYRLDARLMLLPVLPSHNYSESDLISNGYDGDAFSVSSLGNNSALLASAIWDPNSWGQYLGGTHNRRGRNKKFVDHSHIIGYVLYLNKDEAEVRMLCSRAASSLTGCFTVPHARIAATDAYTPLWNLHVHSKQTELYLSISCNCSELN